jgi:glycosyltransferase involved in cell wall biosynthesis
MRVWLITIGEPLPTDGAGDRPQRTGMLCKALLQRKHDVVWWSSTVNHARRTLRYSADTTLEPDDHLQLKLLHSVRYVRNVSVRRLVNHIHLARKFRAMADAEARPDVIICSMPTIELSAAAAEYGKRHGIPVVLDVRDLWPDIFLDVVSPWMRPLVKAGIAPMVRDIRKAFRTCDAVVGVSEGYLDWGLRYAGRKRTPNDAVFPLGYEKTDVSDADLSVATAEMRERGVDPSKTVCWFIGMFGQTYDLRTVVETAREAQQRGLDHVQFVLSGAGDDYEKIVALSDGLRNVVFTGWINGVQIAALTRMADIGLMAYAKGAPQGLPNKLFEYLASGLPVLSSLEGETAEFLRQNECGRSYAAGDSAGLARLIAELAGDPGMRKELGDNGACVYEQKFSAEIVYSRMADFLERHAGVPERQAVSVA